MDKNPFVISGYAGDRYFCDRERETEMLKEYVANGINVTLISPRRIGKTGLVEHLFDQKEIASQYECFLIDIFATKTIDEMVQQLGKAIIRQLSSRGENVLKTFLQTVKSLRPVMSFDFAGNPSFSIAPGEPTQPEQTLDEIFQYLGKSEKPCIVAIDEFQTIAEYPNTKTEALLRTYVQHCPNARFIFSGSKNTMMAEMFTRHSRPFYQSTTLMTVPKLQREVYADFACNLFAEYGKGVEREVVYDVYDRFEGVTWYLQRTLNKLFTMTPTGGRCTMEYVSRAIDGILDENAAAYESLIFQIPPKQKALLMAILADGKAQAITSAAFIRKHGLVSASSVQSAIKGLVEKEFVTNENGAYEAYDKFFALWLLRR